MRSSVGVIIELPEMYKLIDRAGIALEIADKFLVLPALLERREADLLIELRRLCHLADMQRVGSEFVECHGRFPFHWRVDHLERGFIWEVSASGPTSPASCWSWGSASPPRASSATGKSPNRA